MTVPDLESAHLSVAVGSYCWCCQCIQGNCRVLLSFLYVLFFIVLYSKVLVGPGRKEEEDG